MIELKTYKNQTEVDKVFQAEEFDLMLGSIEDVLALFDEIEGETDSGAIATAVVKNRAILYDLILNIFPGMTREDLKKIKVKELLPFFLQLLDYIRNTLRIKN